VQAAGSGSASADSETQIYASVGPWAPSPTPAVHDLVELTRVEDAGLRKAAVHALGSFPDDASAAALAAALSDPVEDVRWNAAVALARRRDPRAAPVLLQMMDRAHLAAMPDLTPDQREDAILQAAAAAGSVPDPALRKALQGLVDADPNLQVKEAARRALSAEP
jgi:HEAT repeat protein